MFKQIILPFAAVAGFIVLVGLMSKGTFNITPPLPTNPINSNSPSPEPSMSPTTKSLTIKNKVLSVEIADTDELRAKGLSGRTSLDEDKGMLFLFNTKKVTPGFWMKDMLMPIDIIWITDGKVSKIDANVQPPKAGVSENRLPVYTPSAPIDYVLEVKAGFSQKFSVKVGDSVTLPSF